MTLYEILGVAESASVEVMEAVWKAHNKHLHPDRNKDPRATEWLKEINNSYTVLSDKVKRAEYDSKMKAERFAERVRQEQQRSSHQSQPRPTLVSKGKRAQRKEQLQKVDSLVDMFVGAGTQFIGRRVGVDWRPLIDIAGPEVGDLLKRQVRKAV